MEEQLKKRLIGATVLVSLAVIFIPMLLESEPVIDNGITETNIPPQPRPVVADVELPVLTSEQIERPQQLGSKPADSQNAPVPKPLIEPVEIERPQPQVTKVEQKTTPPPAKKVPSKVEKPAGKISSWVIQVGSFSSHSNADALVKELRQKGYSAFMEKVTINGKMLYRVRVGPEVDRKLAEKMLTRLNEALASKKLIGSITSYP